MADEFIRLIIDDRERAIIQHSKELDVIKWEKKRIYTGDYAVARGKQLLAVFERKTYEDFAASLKDGRHHNKQNLIEARDKFGCAIYYIIEGPLLPKPTETFAKFPYYVIESAIDHLIIRDKFNVIYTRDSQHTAMRLARFVQSMINLFKKKQDQGPPPDIKENVDVIPTAIDNIAIEGGDPPPADNNEDSEQDQVAAGVMQKAEVNDMDIVREIWSQIKGISVISADMFIAKFTLAELAAGLTHDQLATVAYPNGRHLSDKLINRLIKIDRLTQIKLLATIPGISKVGATQILSGVTLHALLTYDVGAMSIRLVNGKKLGMTKAERIKKYFYYK